MRSIRPIFAFSLALALSAPSFAASNAARSWKIFPSPNDRQANSGNNLSGVAVLSATDAWAVGYSPNGGTGTQHETLIENWNGTRWRVVPSPNVASSTYDVLTGITSVSPTDIWAVGYAGFVGRTPERQTLVEHWNGTRWSIVPSPSPGDHSGNDLFAVNAITSSDIWAVGDFFSGPAGQQGGALTIHWDGTTWSVVQNPGAKASLFGITSLSTNDVWAVGTDMLHWNGSGWSKVRIQVPRKSLGMFMQSVSATSANDIWTAGFYNIPTPEGPFPTALVEHSTGAGFTIVRDPVVSLGLFGIKAVAPNDVWAVGQSNGPPSLIEHWNGTAWNADASPNPGNFSVLNAVDTNPSSPNEAWAVGSFFPSTGPGQLTLVAHHR